jgi:glycosyltransferase involved in cell wall biosynthesis
MHNTFTIGITTFDKRFDMLQALVKSIRSYTENDIIVTVNGNYNEDINEEFRCKSLNFFSTFTRIYPFYFTELRGLAKMINTIFVHSRTENVLILNDDLEIAGPEFFEDLDNAFNGLTDIIKLQNTWYSSFSHYIAKKSFMDELGYYDERLLGFGEEDGDISYRYIQKFNREVPSFGVRQLNHLSSEIRQPVKPGIGKYSFYNRDYMFSEKYKLGEGSVRGMFDAPATMLKPTEKQYPYEKHFMDNKHKLV